MKLAIDFDAKTVVIDDKSGVEEALYKMKAMLPFEWFEYTLLIVPAHLTTDTHPMMVIHLN